VDQEQEFTVRDRRSSSADAGQEPLQNRQEERKTAPAQQGDEQSAVHGHDAGPMPELDFSSFVISLAGTAQMSLGLMPHPETNLVVKNIPAAKQMIDILGMLQGKTKGNLDKEEAALLEQVLFSLRMHYVQVLDSETNAGGR
jgi:Domain of unknown function (DUF1844)